MNTTDAIRSRFSVRAFRDEPVADEQLQALLTAANASPVGMKRYEDVHLTVIRDKEMLKLLDAESANYVGRWGTHPLYGAPMLIIVSARLNSNMTSVGYANAAIMVQNMALQAVELGLGACHIWGVLPALQGRDKLRALNLIPEGFTACAGLAVGAFDGEYTLRDIPLDRVATNIVG